jgi:hypothetical protein
MLTFAQRVKTPQPDMPAKSAALSRVHSGQGRHPNSIVNLQHTLGNQAVLRLLQQAKPAGVEVRSTPKEVTPYAHFLSHLPVHAKSPASVQTKLEVSSPGDIYEQEAERISAQVMHMPEPQLQRACACGGECPKCQMEQLGLEDEHLQTKRVQANDTGQITAPPIVHEVLRAPSQPLDPATRAFMEPRFGRDFSRVRVHEDAAADQSAREVNAHAYTVGNHIVFGRGNFSPQTLRGKQLLAHELTHVVQQTGSSQMIQRQPASPASTPANGGLTDEMLRQIARQLREAMAGLGTDEDAIFSAMAGRTQAQVNAIARVYTEMYGRQLIADLKDELSESEMKHLAMFSPTAAPGAGKSPQEQAHGLSVMVSVRLYQAMRGAGTDEESLISALTGRTADERKAIKEEYKRYTGRELEADLRDELSGDDLTRALRLLNQGLLQPEDEIYLAISGAGTDEAAIFRVLRSLAGDKTKLTALETNYRAKYGDLIQDLRGDLNEDEYLQARQSLVPGILDADVQDCGSTGNPAQTRQSVREAHARAVQMLEIALIKSSNSSDPAVIAAAQRYFKITLPATTDEDRLHWVRVRRALQSLKVAETRATYECEPKQTMFHGFCLSDNVGVTIFNIHLCPDWWTTYTSVDKRAGVLIHEWGHRFGEGVALIFETYCFGNKYATASSEQLITWPDAYMQFVWDLSIGSPAPCF